MRPWTGSATPPLRAPRCRPGWAGAGYHGRSTPAPDAAAPERSERNDEHELRPERDAGEGGRRGRDGRARLRESGEKETARQRARWGGGGGTPESSPAHTRCGLCRLQSESASPRTDSAHARAPIPVAPNQRGCNLPQAAPGLRLRWMPRSHTRAHDSARRRAPDSARRRAPSRRPGPHTRRGQGWPGRRALRRPLPPSSAVQRRSD